MEFVLSPETLAMIAGVILSLIFSYIPGARNWFDQYAPEAKRLIMLVLLAVVAFGSYGLACAGILTGIACTVPGAIDVVWTLILAVIANQAAYSISPKVG